MWIQFQNEIRFIHVTFIYFISVYIHCKYKCRRRNAGEIKKPIITRLSVHYLHLAAVARASGTSSSLPCFSLSACLLMCWLHSWSIRKTRDGNHTDYLNISAGSPCWHTLSQREKKKEMLTPDRLLPKDHNLKMINTWPSIEINYLMLYYWKQDIFSRNRTLWWLLHLFACL